MDVDHTAATVGFASTDDTATVAGIITQRAFIGYMAPLGYSAMADDDLWDEPEDADDPRDAAVATSEPFLLVGSALVTIFVVGVSALVASLVVTIRPTADQRPEPGGNAAVSSTLPVSAAPETIANPVPVVQEAPRTVFVTPRGAAPAAPAATFEPQAPAPAPEAPPQPAPAPVVAPVPMVPPIMPQLLPQPVPQIVAPRDLGTPPPRSPATTPAMTPATTPATTPAPTRSVPSPSTSSTTTQQSSAPPTAAPSSTTPETSSAPSTTASPST
ncbi:MAG: hypothetical protein WCJ53_02060, partial [Mycobacteriaceae bacterium]